MTNCIQPTTTTDTTDKKYSKGQIHERTVEHAFSGYISAIFRQKTWFLAQSPGGSALPNDPKFKDFSPVTEAMRWFSARTRTHDRLAASHFWGKGPG